MVCGHNAEEYTAAASFATVGASLGSISDSASPDCYIYVQRNPMTCARPHGALALVHRTCTRWRLGPSAPSSICGGVLLILPAEEALDRRDMADRVFGPFRDRFFPDEFLGWRCACVAGGMGCYADVLAGRSAPLAGTRFEELVFAPMRVWARRHGANPDAYPHRPVPSCQAFGNRDGWT